MLCTIGHIEEADSDARDTQTVGHGQPCPGKATWRHHSQGRGFPQSIQTVGTHDSRSETKIPYLLSSQMEIIDNPIERF